MLFTYDYYKNLKQSLMILANPQKEYIGVIHEVENLSLSINFNDISKATFKLYESSDLYNKIEKKRLIEIQYVAWFQIENVTEHNDGLVAYKDVECLTLENELVGKRVDDINGTFALYDVVEPEYSLLHIISSASGWNIGHIDNELIGKWRTFSLDTDKVYNILTTEISKSFECVFQFDTYTRTINTYKLENIGKLTDIFISKRNLLKEYILESNSEIVTKLKVLGGDGFDIRYVNPTGTNYLINVDYYKVPISEGGWMTDGLINALNAYQTAYSNKITQHTNLVNSIKALQVELETLTSQLTDLEGYKKAQDEIVGSYITMYNGTPPIGSPEYSSYLKALNLSNSYVGQIANKSREIINKESSIESVRDALNNISLDLSQAKYFTPEQLIELNTFLTENEAYEDSTFTVTDIMSDDEVTDMAIELMSNGASELARVSRPQYTIKITAKNLFTLADESTMKIGFEKWREQLSVGNLVTLSLRKDLCTTVRILSIEVDFDDLENMTLVLSDKSSLDDNTIQLEELLANAGKASSSLSLKQFGYDQASKITSDVREFMNSTFDATLNAIQNNKNQEVYFDEYGLHIRKFMQDQNKYNDCQSWWVNNVLLFTDDGWKSSKAGIGQFTTQSGEKFYGVMADVVCGQLIMGERLSITNSSGTYTINNNGFTASSKVGSNTYVVGINPSTPSDIFNIKVNGSKKLYVDTVTNKLVFSGDLDAVGGTFSGNLSGANGTFSGTVSAGKITGSEIEGTTIKGGKIEGTEIIGSVISSTVRSEQNFTINTTLIDSGLTINVTDGINSSTNLYWSGLIFDNKSANLLAQYSYTGIILTNKSKNGAYFTINETEFKYKDSNVLTSSSISNYLLSKTNQIEAVRDTPTSTGDYDAIRFISGDGAYRAATTSFVISKIGSSSDRRLKQNIVEIDDISEKYLALNPVYFDYKEGVSGGRNGKCIGFIADEVSEIFPINEYNVVTRNNTELSDNQKELCPDGMLEINDKNLHALHVKMIQKLQKEIIELYRRLEDKKE